MEKLDFSGVPVVHLESLRIRLAQLVLSLTGLSNRVQAAELPAWPALHQQFSLVLLQLSSLVSTLASFAPTLKRAVAYPMPSFPIKTQSWLLMTLLRKKNLPEVDEWIAEGVEASKEIDTARDDEFCSWALEQASQNIALDNTTGIVPSTAPNGWPVDKVISLMSGQAV